MNRLPVGIIAFCALATLAGLFAFRRQTPTNDPDRQSPDSTAVTAAIDDRSRLTPVDASPAREYLPENDTTGLLQESLTVDGLIDEVNADHGAGFAPVERKRFKAAVMSDPALRRAFGE